MTDLLTDPPLHVSPYARMILRGLWADGYLNRSLMDLTSGMQVEVIVPLDTALIQYGNETLATATQERARFKATRLMEPTHKFEVWGSLQPEKKESWLRVGKIN